MKLGVLFSGGKDSCYATELASEEHEISCLLTINSENKDSFMFHTPAIKWTEIQAESMSIAHLFCKTSGNKDSELEDLKDLIKQAISDYQIEGIVTGAIASVYQASRIQDICADLNLWCFNPLWQSSQTELLLNLISGGYEICITAVAAESLDESWLGKQITIETISKLLFLAKKYRNDIIINLVEYKRCKSGLEPSEKESIFKSLKWKEKGNKEFDSNKPCDEYSTKTFTSLAAKIKCKRAKKN